jgi:integrase
VGNIARRQDGRWRARYRDAAGREHARHFTRKVDAQKWLDAITTAVNTGTYVDPNLAGTTIADWAPRWLDTKTNLKATTRAAYEALLRHHVLPAWGTHRLADVSHEGVGSWVGELRTKQLSASTIRQTYRVLSLMLDLAVRDGRLARNPALGVPLPRPATGRRTYLSHADVRALADAAGPQRTVVLFLAYTGVRFGELAALRVGRLDLAGRRAVIAESMAEVRGHAVFSTPKNHQTRSVPVPRFLLDDLNALTAGKADDDFVFTAPQGGVLRLRNFRHAVFDPAAKAIGRPDLTPHALRHSAASLAIAAGANVKVVQTMLGHQSATMTLDLYGHLFADQLDEVADALDRARTAANERDVKQPVADRLRTDRRIPDQPSRDQMLPGLDFPGL